MPRPGFEPGSSAIFAFDTKGRNPLGTFCVAGLDDRGWAGSVSCVNKCLSRGLGGSRSVTSA